MRTRRHTALRVSAASAMVAAAVLGSGVPSGAAEVRPAAYAGEALATGIGVFMDTNPGLAPVADLTHVDVPLARSNLASSGSVTARASLAYPGGGLLGLPGLICFAAPQVCPVPPPNYPLIADASHPDEPDATGAIPVGAVPPLGPVGAGAGTMRAHADPDLVEATSSTAGASLAGVLTVESITTRTKQFFDGAALVVTAESVASGLSIADGVVKIDAVRSIATGRVDGRKVFSSKVDTIVSGVTVAGQEATIDDKGVRVLGSGDDGLLTGAVNDAAEAALAETGITLRTVDATQQAAADGVAAAGAGLLLSFDVEVELPVPYPVSMVNRKYFGTVSIASAGVRAFASDERFGGDELPVLDDFGSEPAPPEAEVEPGIGSVALPEAPSPAVADEAPLAAAPSVAQPPTAVTAGRPAVDLTGERVRWIALALLLYPLFVLLSAVRRAPARLPAAT